MKKFITNKYVIYILGIALFFGIWTLTSLIVNSPVSVFPDPIRTIKEAFSYLGDVYLYRCLGYSLLRMAIGFGIALILALVFGIIAGNSPYLQKLFHPTMTILKAIPTACMVLLFLVLMGAKSAPILIVVLISFPILYEAIVGGFNNINKDIKEALEIESNNPVRKTFMVKLPLAIPYVLVGISSSFALSFKIEIMAEIISGDTSYGLGVAISYAQSHNPSNMVPVFAYAFIAIILMLIVTLLANIIKKKFNLQDLTK